MATGSQTLKSELGYVTDLFEAGFDGVRSAWRCSDRHIMTRPGYKVGAPAVLGAALGFVGARLAQRPRRMLATALGGVVGSALGAGIGAAWSSRDFMRKVARGAIKDVNAVRDAHWLEKNPITYA